MVASSVAGEMSEPCDTIAVPITPSKGARTVV